LSKTGIVAEGPPPEPSQLGPTGWKNVTLKLHEIYTHIGSLRRHESGAPGEAAIRDSL